MGYTSGLNGLNVFCYLYVAYSLYGKIEFSVIKWQINEKVNRRINQREQESLADAKVSEREQCVYEGP